MAVALLGNSSLQKWGILHCNSEDSKLALNNLDEFSVPHEEKAGFRALFQNGND